jgi:rhamnogalacturonyl hydrolase YesR
MKLHEALDKVKDKASFFEFLHVLIEDREVAEALEQESPEKWQWGGANGWQNSAISSFLECASCYFNEESSEELSWRDFAEFLYFGKIYE